MAFWQDTAQITPELIARIVEAVDNGTVVQNSSNTFTVAEDGFTVSLTGTFSYEHSVDQHPTTGTVTGMLVSTTDGAELVRADQLNGDVATLDRLLVDPQAVLRYLERGNDTIISNQAAPNGDVDHGYGGDDFIVGGPGNDWFYGDRGDDVLLGQAGDDHLWGGRGKDILNGGSGNDILTGGCGRDTFVVLNGYGHDTIRDFVTGRSPNHDVLQLPLADFATVNDALAAAQQDGLNTVIHLNGNDDVTLLNVDSHALTRANIQLV